MSVWKYCETVKSVFEWKLISAVSKEEKKEDNEEEEEEKKREQNQSFLIFVSVLYAFWMKLCIVIVYM